MNIWTLLYTRTSGFDLFFSDDICLYLITNLLNYSSEDVWAHCKHSVCISRLANMVEGKN